jgi:hypothetical protein
MNSEPRDAADCENFQEKVAERLAVGDKTFYQDPHLENCAYCRGILVDLETISEAARDLLGPTD